MVGGLGPDHGATLPGVPAHDDVHGTLVGGLDSDDPREWILGVATADRREARRHAGPRPAGAIMPRAPAREETS
jgi:hypothetical protein